MVAPSLWGQERVNPLTATKDQIATAIDGFERLILANKDTKLNFGPVSSAKAPKAKKVEDRRSDPANVEKTPDTQSRNARRRAKQRKFKKEGDEANREVAALRDEIKQLRAATFAGAAHSGPTYVNTRSPNTQASQGN
ncbi:hypothetical protein IWW57_001456 [Coemansia sp. S610]|nr:hypothetical protein GGI06_005423 [Coemansia sp. S85]KAJ2029860.1 hypothetical protein IWW57_001456 [Coemansia sp. S610]KAJ2417629.1 hypothetical protein GGI10_000034 [Coemansia sp. RSA 2530]